MEISIRHLAGNSPGWKYKFGTPHHLDALKIKRLAWITTSVEVEKEKTAVSTGALQRCGKWRDEGRSTNETEKEQSVK